MKTLILIVSTMASAGHVWSNPLLSDAVSEGKNDGRNMNYRNAPLVTLQQKLAKLRRANASTSGIEEVGKKQTIFDSSEEEIRKNKHVLSSDAFISAFDHVMTREFPEASEGLSSLFRTVIMKPAAQKKNVSAESMKRQMVNFLDLIKHVEKLPPEDERLRDILEVFAYMPVVQPNQRAERVKEYPPFNSKMER